jgi:hypothetical protein
MRKILLVAVAMSGMSLLATLSASTAPVGGAAVLIGAAKSPGAVQTVDLRCRITCWRYAGERICRKRCYER